MKLNTRLVVITVIVLAVVAAISAYLNRDYVQFVKEAQARGEFVIRARGDEFAVSVEDIHALSPVDVRANYKITGFSAETRVYQGVSLKAVLDSLGIDYDECQSVLFTAADGYTSILRPARALDSENCYIVISEGGKPLGTLESGGTGPFMMILPSDRFSQSWCKYLLEVTLR
jgi:Tfp pilus assembly protein PilE